MTKEDSLLIAGICGALRQLESDHRWDLSTGEVAAFLQIFYEELKKGIPNNRAVIQEIFQKAYCHVYGDDHECDNASTAEMLLMLDYCSDFYIATAPAGANMINLYDEFRSLLNE